MKTATLRSASGAWGYAQLVQALEEAEASVVCCEKAVIKAAEAKSLASREAAQEYIELTWLELDRLKPHVRRLDNVRLNAFHAEVSATLFRLDRLMEAVARNSGVRRAAKILGPSSRQA